MDAEHVHSVTVGTGLSAVIGALPDTLLGMSVDVDANGATE